jgi:uncharacterized protein (TIGR03067 family)
MRHAILTVTLAVACVAAQPVDDVVKKDLKEFQGKWTAIVAHDTNGKALSTEELKETKLVVEGNKFTLKSGETMLEGEFKIDPTKKIKTIDIFLGDDRTKPIVKGIYEIKEDTRRSCFAIPDKERPTEFRKEVGFLYLEWKKTK